MSLLYADLSLPESENSVGLFADFGGKIPVCKIQCHKQSKSYCTIHCDHIFI